MLEAVAFVQGDITHCARFISASSPRRRVIFAQSSLGPIMRTQKWRRACVRIRSGLGRQRPIWRGLCTTAERATTVLHSYCAGITSSPYCQKSHVHAQWSRIGLMSSYRYEIDIRILRFLLANNRHWQDVRSKLSLNLKDQFRQARPPGNTAKDLETFVDSSTT